MFDRVVVRQLGEWAQAVHRACTGRGVSDSLTRAPAGAGETVAVAGGFLVPEALAPFILGSIYEDRYSIISYCLKLNIPDGTNSLKVPGVDETSRADGLRWGGIIVDYEDEGITQNLSFPRLQQTEFAAPKMIGLVAVTAELLADAENLGTFLLRGFTDELTVKLEEYILSSKGTGAGKPISVINAPALFTANAEGGQTAHTINIDNLNAMWASLPSASRKRAVWAGSETALAQAGASTFEPVYAPSGCTNPNDVPRIKGRPAIETEVMPAVGTLGDILLIDPAWYAIASKPMQWAMSGDVLFLNDQLVFRITWRVNAGPLVSTALTALDGTQRSPFVALAAR